MSALARRWRTFWFESEVLVVRLTTFRVVFFSLLGLDLWLLMVPHGQRHGFGEFNVSHIPALDRWLFNPNAAVMTAAYLLAGWLALRVALGLALRASLIALTLIYNATYFWSQVDSYQHHYLIGLLLLLCCFVPFEATAGVERGQRAAASPGVKAWAIRLMYVQIAIVYFYTALTKLTPLWLDGWALDRIVSVPWARALYASCAGALGWSALGPYALVAHVIMIWQFCVAIAFLVPRLRKLACATGPLFHGLVEALDLKIGWFSYYMIAAYYILLFPDDWFLALCRPLEGLRPHLRSVYERLTRPGPEASVPLRAATALGCAGAALLVPLPGRAGLALGVALIVMTGLQRVGPAPATAGSTRAAAHGLIALLMVVLVRLSDVPYDYYRYWASQLSEQGKLELAAEKYELANHFARGEPARHLRLAELYVALGRYDDALRTYRRALAFEGQRERAQRGIERVLGRTRAAR